MNLLLSGAYHRFSFPLRLFLLIVSSKLGMTRNIAVMTTYPQTQTLPLWLQGKEKGGQGEHSCVLSPCHVPGTVLPHVSKHHHPIVYRGSVQRTSCGSSHLLPRALPFPGLCTQPVVLCSCNPLLPRGPACPCALQGQRKAAVKGAGNWQVWAWGPRLGAAHWCGITPEVR